MNKVRETREQQGFTVTEFARQLGVSRSTIYRIEEGEINPRDHLKKEIAELLQTTVGFLFFNEFSA